MGRFQPVATCSNRPIADVGKRPLPARSGHAPTPEWYIAGYCITGLRLKDAGAEDAEIRAAENGIAAVESFAVLLHPV